MIMPIPIQSSAPEKEEMFAAALNTVVPAAIDEGAALPEGGAAATAVPESVSLPAVMGDGGEAPALTPEPLLSQAATTPLAPIDSAQAETAGEAQTSDPEGTTTLLPPPTPASDQQAEKNTLPVQTATVVTKSEEEAEKAPQSASKATPQASSLPVLVTATSMPAAEPPATADLVAEPEHFSGCATHTGSNASIMFPQDMALSGLVLDSGDEIAIFTSDGALCAGSAVWTGQNIAATIWADNSQTEVADGLRDGEEMKFRIWDRSTGTEIPIKTVEYVQGRDTFANEGIYVVAALLAE